MKPIRVFPSRSEAKAFIDSYVPDCAEAKVVRIKTATFRKPVFAINMILKYGSADRGFFRDTNPAVGL